MASKINLLSFVFCAIFATAMCDSCKNPTVTSTTFTSRDSAVVMQTAFVTEFSLNCDNSLPTGFVLYAEVEGRTMPAARIANNKYQVSWTEENARGGERRVRLYSEEGYTALRKALRSEEPTDSVPSISDISISYSAGFGGPGINSEVIAAFLAIGVSYVAIINKRKLLA